MAIPFLNNITLDNNEIQNVRLHNTGTSNNAAGQIFFNTGVNLAQYYANSIDQWVTLKEYSFGNGTFINNVVTGTTAKPIITPDLSATGTPSITTYLRGDNAWEPISAIPGTYTWEFDGDSGTTQTVASGDTVTFTGTTKITTTALAGDQLTIEHDLQSQSNTTSSASPADGATFTVIDSVAIDSTGHVGGKNIKTITLPTFPTIPTVSDATITLTGGAGIVDVGGAFTLNQSGNEEITFNVGAGGGITVNANNVEVDVDNATIQIIGSGVAAKTAAVANAGTALATGDQIYDFVTGQIANIPSGLSFEGSWNASTDSPDLSTATPDNGQFWIVSVAGTTDLDGIDEWAVGDWAIYVSTGAGTDGWQKVDNSSTLSGFGDTNQVTYWTSTGNVAGDSGFIYNPTGSNLMVQGAITSFGGNSGEWNLAYDNSITALTVTGTATKTLTATQQDGGIISTSWTDDNTEYSMMTSSVLGLGKLFSDTTQTVAATAVSDTSSRTYGIQKNSSNQLVVNVPWEDTNSGGTVTGVTGVSPIAVTSSTTTPIVSIATATGSAIGAGNVVAGTGYRDGLSVVYSNGTATVGLDISGMNVASGLVANQLFFPAFNDDAGTNMQVSAAELSDLINPITSKAYTITDTATITYPFTLTTPTQNDTIIQLVDTVTNETVHADVDRISTTQATITFASTPDNSIRVLVQKIG